MWEGRRQDTRRKGVSNPATKSVEGESEPKDKEEKKIDFNLRKNTTIFFIKMDVNN